MFSQGEPTPEVTLKQTLPEVIHPNQVRHLTSMRKGVAMFLEYLNIRGQPNFQLEIRANATEKDGLYSWIPSTFC
jgi:ArsR family metal-binding transcriptional regulator